jgi:hypothetical protein
VTFDAAVEQAEVCPDRSKGTQSREIAMEASHRISQDPSWGWEPFGRNGPVGMQVIDGLVEALEAHEQRIEELEKKLSS